MPSMYVYGLRFRKEGHEFDGLIRYVGSTRNPKRRLYSHWSPGSDCRAMREAFAEHGRDAWRMEVLAEFHEETLGEALELARACEAQLVVEFETASGAHGLNMTTDGQSGSIFGEYAEAANARKAEGIRRSFENPEKRAAYAERMRKTAANPDVRAKAAASIRKRFEDPDFKAAYTKRINDVISTPEWKARHAEVIAEIAKDETVKAKRRATLLELCQDPEHRKKHLEGIRKRDANPVSRLRRSIGVTRRWAKHADAHGLPQAAKHWARVAELEEELNKHG